MKDELLASTLFDNPTVSRGIYKSLILKEIYFNIIKRSFVNSFEPLI